MEYNKIIETIDNHLKKSAKRYYRDFYIGITEDVNGRLFGYHKVNRDADWWIYCSADTEEVAREVEKYYLDKGMDGGDGGGRGNGMTRFIYCYEINDNTKEREG